jgi:hypothetical protein
MINNLIEWNIINILLNYNSSIIILIRLIIEIAY